MNKKEISTRHDGTPYTVLTDEILEEFYFINNGQCSFQCFENMSYWVKNGICLFYNTPVMDFQESYYIGYAEMRQGKYFAVGFRWIDSVEELTTIYESIIQQPIKEDKAMFYPA